MNAALLVLRLIPGLLFVGHGLQKLIPAKHSPPLLSAMGPHAFAGGLERMGIRPALPLAVVTGAGELVGGALLALGLVTPVATVLLSAVMTVAILRVHLRNGIWNTAGGFEFPLLMATCAYVVTALGPGRLSLDASLGIGNWFGLSAANADLKAAVAIAIGVAGGGAMLVVARVAESLRHTGAHPAH